MARRVGSAAAWRRRTSGSVWRFMTSGTVLTDVYIVNYQYSDRTPGEAKGHRDDDRDHRDDPVDPRGRPRALRGRRPACDPGIVLLFGGRHDRLRPVLHP